MTRHRFLVTTGAVSVQHSCLIRSEYTAVWQWLLQHQFTTPTKYSLQSSKSFSWILCPTQEEKFTYKVHKSSLNKIAKNIHLLPEATCGNWQAGSSTRPDTDVWGVTHSPTINFITTYGINVTKVMFVVNFSYIYLLNHFYRLVLIFFFSPITKSDFSLWFSVWQFLPPPPIFSIFLQNHSLPISYFYHHQIHTAEIGDAGNFRWTRWQVNEIKRSEWTSLVTKVK